MSKPIGWNCQKCAQDPQYLGGTVWVKNCTNPALLANAASVTCSCGTKCIPVFAICNPPEPTVIDESDLAPGMVVVAVDDFGSAEAFLCSPDVVMYDDMFGVVMAKRMRYLDDIDESVVRRVSGDPC